MHTVSFGIVAHVDAGKTSLTERLLYAAGVIDEVGSVDDGSTRTDSLELERRRGITIKSAVVSFTIDDVTVNLIDTPGHPDFIAEVERVLGVLDGAILVVSAVEGVQAQTRVLMRTLQRLRIPTLVFVNKTDRAGARPEGVLRDIAGKLTPAIVPMHDLSGLAELLADHDDAILAAYVDDRTLPRPRLRRELAAQTARGLVHPVYLGSAVTGAGVDSLMSGIAEFLPAADGDADAPVSGTVFKIDRGPANEKFAYARLASGTIRVRDRLRFGPDGEGKVTAIRVFDHGAAVRSESLGPGRIGMLHGLGGVRVGDPIGAAGPASDRHHFAPPTLETVVMPRRAADRSALHTALAQLAEQDPLIGLRQDDVRQETYISLYGEVQKEVIQATLANDFGVDVTFHESTTICVERPIGTGSAVEVMHEGANPFVATVGLRVDAAPIGTGVRFGLGVELGSMPYSFFKAVEETVTQTLHQGLRGWQVTDCRVTMTHSGYTPPPPYGWSKLSSSAGDFRRLTPLVLMDALKRAGTRVHEPIHHFHLEMPADTFGAVSPALARLHAVPRTTTMQGPSYLVEGDIPAARVHELETLLSSLTRGEGMLVCTFDRYEPVRGTVPARPRTDHNPLNRREYLLQVQHGVAMGQDCG